MANLIDKYRATHRRIRQYLDPYTARLCPTCPEPCCRKPTKVRDFDVILARAAGYDIQARETADEFVNACVDALSGQTVDEPLEPCDYLGEQGCVFPNDLRPFECTKWTCSFLRKEISPSDMRELRHLLSRLSDLHRQIVDATMPRSRK
jgi:hypothetical protein